MGFESETLDRYLKASSGTDRWNELRDAALVTWFNYQRRRIPVHPRKVVPNPALNCPPDVLQGWEMLKKEISDGADLNPRLSRKIENADYKDGLLYDWGVHHFHLGTVSDPKHPRLIQGTACVLLAIVDESDFYPIDFATHEQWGNLSILEQAITAFPKRFEQFQVDGVTGIDNPCTGKDIVEMRRRGMNSLVEVAGKVYAPPGMGVTMAGTSIGATIELDHYRQQLVQLENQIKKQYDSKHHSCTIQLVRSFSAERATLKIRNTNYALVSINPN